MTYAITGASGHLGRLTAEALLHRVEPGELVLITRTPDRLTDLAARGVDVCGPETSPVPARWAPRSTG